MDKQTQIFEISNSAYILNWSVTDTHVLAYVCTEYKNISILLLIITVLVISCYSFLEFHCLNVHVHVFAQILFWTHFPPTDCAVSFCHKVVYYLLLVIWFLYDLEQEQYTLNNHNCYIFIVLFYVFISALPIIQW